MNTHRTGTPEARASRTPHGANPTRDPEPPTPAPPNYLRISADEQHQHLSLQSQQASLRRHIDQLGWETTWIHDMPSAVRDHRHSNP